MFGTLGHSDERDGDRPSQKKRLPIEGGPERAEGPNTLTKPNNRNRPLRLILSLRLPSRLCSSLLICAPCKSCPPSLVSVVANSELTMSRFLSCSRRRLVRSRRRLWSSRFRLISHDLLHNRLLHSSRLHPPPVRSRQQWL